MIRLKLKEDAKIKIIPLILIGLLIFAIGCSAPKQPTPNQQPNPSGGGCGVVEGSDNNYINNLVEITHF